MIAAADCLLEAADKDAQDSAAAPSAKVAKRGLCCELCGQTSEEPTGYQVSQHNGCAS